eukprot:SAG11_NODE_15788_length_566_cov_1.092077_1_plen_51_part_10
MLPLSHRSSHPGVQIVSVAWSQLGTAAWLGSGTPLCFLSFARRPPAHILNL